MRLYPSVATENTIQYNNRSSYFSTGTKEKKIITSDITTIKKYLLTTSILISWFGSSKCGDFMNDVDVIYCCLLYTSDAADERSSVDLGGRRIIKKKKK